MIEGFLKPRILYNTSLIVQQPVLEVFSSGLMTVNFISILYI